MSSTSADMKEFGEGDLLLLLRRRHLFLGEGERGGGKVSGHTWLLGGESEGVGEETAIRHRLAAAPSWPASNSLCVTSRSWPKIWGGKHDKAGYGNIMDIELLDLLAFDFRFNFS